MTMNVQLPGQINGAGADDALFLKLFAGEVLTAFSQSTVMMERHMVRTIMNGKSASFPAMGRTGAAYHVPGQLIDGSQSVNHAERIINIDDFLLSDIFVAKIDELKNHYDIRSEYTKQMGEALAKAADQRLLQVTALAARDSATVTGLPGGTQLTDAAMKTDTSVFISALYDAAAKFDENDVPQSDRIVIVSPSMFYKLVTDKSLINQDFSNGNGDFAKGIVDTAAGFKIVKSNNLPTGVVSAATGENNTYSGDFTKTAAIAFHKSAIGTVKLADLSVSKTADDGDFMTMYNGTLMTAKYAMGHGVLRPEAAIEFATP